MTATQPPFGRREFFARLAPALLLRRRGESGAEEFREEFDPRRAAFVVCDMWDRHWCRGANERVALMAPPMNALLSRARARGATIIHAPSDTMEFYRDTSQRRAVLELPAAQPREVRQVEAPPLPIDDSDGGCDTPGDKTFKAWTRQHPGLDILPGDFITDKGAEVYRVLVARATRTLFLMGVHTNMCILNRTFAIKQMTRWGVRCVLVRDLTDAMYDPADRPYVSHERGTELVVEHIERYWCPSTTSTALLAELDRAK